MSDKTDYVKTNTDYVKINHGKPGLMPRIPALWAFLAVDEDGDEGVCAFFNAATPQMPACWLPMVAADPKRLDALKAQARGMAKAGTTIRLVKFSVREDVSEISGSDVGDSRDFGEGSDA